MVEENKVILRRYGEEIWNRGNMAAIDELISPHFSVPGPFGAPDLKGTEGFTQLVTGMRLAFPDMHLTPEEMIAEGDTVAVRWRIRGTHHGEFFGIAPTGKAIETTNTQFYFLEGGKIVGWAGDMDLLGLMQQLGAVPPLG